MSPAAADRTRSAAARELAFRVKQLAQQHGFDHCGITRPEITDRDARALNAWIAAGMHADMAWMAETTRMQRRLAPKSMLDGVQSVISVAMRYTPPAPPPDRLPRGRVSAYAVGRDYHDVMKQRLKQLARALDELLGWHDQRVFVDTAPVLEHTLAGSASVAWQGKHSLSLNRTSGSWFLLGELFTTARLPSDAPSSAHCGSCTACMEGCPTRAIVAPYVVDSRRCIAWLTIEYSGIIPRDLRPLMGNRIYGCDECQAVCPWNRTPPPLPRDLLEPDHAREHPLLSEVIDMDEDKFRHRFRGSPIRRSGRLRLIRNAIVAAGNSRNSELIPPLLRRLHDPDAGLRLHAVWALARLHRKCGDDTIEAALVSLRGKECDSSVREELRISWKEIATGGENR